MRRRGAAKYDIDKHVSGLSLVLTRVFYCNFPKALLKLYCKVLESDVEIGIQYLNILGNSEIGVLECWSKDDMEN